VAAVACDAQHRIIGQLLLDRGAPLLLVDSLARIELEGDRIDLSRIRIPLGTRETERVFCLRLMQEICDERDASVT